MDIFNSEFLDALRNIAIAVGLLYSPLLFANGILDVMLKFRQWSGNGKRADHELAQDPL